MFYKVSQEQEEQQQEENNNNLQTPRPRCSRWKMFQIYVMLNWMRIEGKLEEKPVLSGWI